MLRVRNWKIYLGSLCLIGCFKIAAEIYDNYHAEDTNIKIGMMVVILPLGIFLINKGRKKQI